MRRQLAVGLGEIEIVGEFRATGLLAVANARLDLARPTFPRAATPVEVGMFGEALDQDRPRAFQRRLDVSDGMLAVFPEEFLGFRSDSSQGPAAACRRALKAGFLGDLRLVRRFSLNGR